jgi:hypothetical protein
MAVAKSRLLNRPNRLGSKMPFLRSPEKKNSSSTETSDKHVQFSEEIQVIPAIEELSEKDLMDCFQQQQDLATIEEEIMMTARRHYHMSPGESGAPFDENKYTLRGIEHVGSPSLLKLQIREKTKLMQVLWAEQTRQRDSSTYPNMEKFREVCRKISGPAKERALALAQDDERVAKGVPTGVPTKRCSRAAAFVKSIRRLTGAPPE